MPCGKKITEKTKQCCGCIDFSRLLTLCCLLDKLLVDTTREANMIRLASLPTLCLFNVYWKNIDKLTWKSRSTLNDGLGSGKHQLGGIIWTSPLLQLESQSWLEQGQWLSCSSSSYHCIQSFAIPHLPPIAHHDRSIVLIVTETKEQLALEPTE